ncbi:MAG: sigma-70 family RNA polymerase sigma factor [Planctomycetaceae bacterium]|nr:sigma-70 family RNA polymerase sigma factor [Planctomycetaceae bacterium]
MSGVTQILAAIDRGEPQAAEQLLPLVYDELRKLAAVRLAQERPGQTLDATALVHEAYLRLVGPAGPAALDAGADSQPKSRPAVETCWNDRVHFFRAAAEAMRRVLVDHARRKRSDKRGGGRSRVELVDPPARQSLADEDVVAISEALARLQQHDPVKAELVKLRYFAGLTLVEAAEVLGISRATADRYWAYAKVWLYRELRPAGDGTKG